MSRTPGAATVLLVLALALVTGAALSAAAPPTDADVDAVARELRCVVCQNLSVADSPTELARQMRALVRERLAHGDSPAAVKAYFVSRYGEWVLLVPPTEGFALVAWLAPLFGLLGGFALAAVAVARWRRRAETALDAPDADAADLAVVRRAVSRRRP